MKILKYGLLLVVLTSFYSCLKSRSDVGGLLNDKGSILVSIVEKAYLNSNAQNIGLGIDHGNANFNFSKRPNESVKFFSVKITQARETKMTGPIVIKVKASPVTNSLYNLGGVPSAVPAGAITVSDITIPQSSSDVITVPVFFTVNKTLLNPATIDYGVKFELTATSQGVISELDKEVDVLLNYSDLSINSNLSDYEASYNYTCSVVDPSGQFGINNVKPMYIRDDVGAGVLRYFDPYVYAFGASNGAVLYVNNFFTGARTAVFAPAFNVNASGKITGVSGIAGVALDPASGPSDNQFVYTSNTERSLTLKYTFPLTTAINGVNTTRTLTVNETFSYNGLQIYE
jgi:hypothetical protein